MGCQLADEFVSTPAQLAFQIAAVELKSDNEAPKSPRDL